MGGDTAGIDYSLLDSFGAGGFVVFEIAAAMGSSLAGDGMYIVVFWDYRFSGSWSKAEFVETPHLAGKYIDERGDRDGWKV